LDSNGAEILTLLNVRSEYISVNSAEIYRLISRRQSAFSKLPLLPSDKVVNQDEWQERNNRYLERYDASTARVEELERLREERQHKAKTIEIFIRGIEKHALVIAEFDNDLRSATVECVKVQANGKLIWTWQGEVK